MNPTGGLQPAVAAFRRGELGDAERLCRDVLAADPCAPDAHHLLALVQARAGRPAEALASCDEALALRPDDPQMLCDRGAVLHQLRRFDEALEAFDRALALAPDCPEFLCNRGATLHRLGRYEEALASYDEAARLRPGFPEALSSRGATLCLLGRYAEALASFRAALALRPDYPNAHRNMARTLLLCGRFDAGWREYEWRRAGVPSSHPAAPEWQGEKLRGRRLLLYAEQGLGDTIQFARFARVFAARGAVVVAEVQRRLAALMGSLDGAAAIVARGDPLPEVDYQLPMMSAPFRLALGERQIPSTVPYLRADRRRVAAWSHRLPPCREFRIGIAWQGNPLADLDQGRSIPLSAFAPLGLIPGVRLISIQQCDGLQQLAALPAAMRVDDPGDGFDAGPGGFLDAAAAMMHLDLIVASDSAVAHLAGALGRPVWIVLQQVPDWRWLLHRADTPWYPTARLFRQQRQGDWPEVFARAAAALAPLVAGKAASAALPPAAAAGQSAAR